MYIYINNKHIPYALYIYIHILFIFNNIYFPGFCLATINRSMGRSWLLLIDQITTIRHIGFGLKTLTTLELKVVAPSMAMEGYGGKTHAKLTNLLYVYIFHNLILN